MNIKKCAAIAFIFVISIGFWAGYVNFIQHQEPVVSELPEQKPAYYRLRDIGKGEAISAAIFIRNKEIFRFTRSAGGITPRQRAVAVVNRLNKFIYTGANPDKIFPGVHNGIPVITYENKVLITTKADKALLWANKLRTALGSTELINDIELFKLLASTTKKPFSFNEIGIASWYGGYFHGRTAADGSTYNMYEFTAAHKSLPFGSVVKVTNLKNNDSVVVKITDRGPFIDGRIIDLSKVAAEEIGMLGSGISKVKIEVLGRV